MARPHAPAAPIVAGTLLALLSAVLFGASTPAVQYLGRGLGPFTTAGLLYTGAALLAGLAFVTSRREDAPLRRRHLPRLLAVAVTGALLAPAALAWGLSRSSGVAASLLVNLEAVFTLILGAAVHREHVGRRVALAALLMTAGGALVVAGSRLGGGAEVWGLVAVTLATLGWAADNTLARSLADLDPAQVVASKGALGALFSFAVAWLRGEPLPSAPVLAAGLCAVGAVGYGSSLRLYLLAQRRLGAARTASVFAVAPFAGAAVARMAGQPLGGGATVAGGLLLAIGVALHLTESHAHEHEHAPVEHEHAHRHDDGHHDHAHDLQPPGHGAEPGFAGRSPIVDPGEHSHPHRHEATRHEHPHAPDLHHQHDHDHA